MTWLNESLSPGYCCGRNIRLLAASGLKCSGKEESFSNEFSEGQNIGMITARRICREYMRLQQNYLDTLTLTAEAEQCSSFCRRISRKVQRFSPKPYQHECVMLTRPWPHPLGVYLELARERETVQHSPLGAHEEADVSEKGPNGKTRFKTMDKVWRRFLLCVCLWARRFLEKHLMNKR